ncbi:hypothetical protein Droror1_Dr00010702 [Drosera rotundifolia]
METTPVNWESLDTIVIEFAKSEHLIDDSSSSPPLSPSSYQSRLLIRQIRRSIESADIDAALDLLRVHAPKVLDDQRLPFRLQKQKFIELLRRGTAKDRELAIRCLRTGLAPCALGAYPEAYEEFKHILLALIYDKDDQNSPVAKEWSDSQRLEIAGLVSSILRAHLRAYDPVLSMTLRYLISVHKAFCFRQGTSSPISDLTERLLLEERDPPAIPQESLTVAPPFDEVDIQALAHAVELTRQKAVDSLRVAKGDLSQAFQNELCRMRLNISALDELVQEYCIYRGIVLPVVISSSGLKEQSPLEPETSCCSPRNCSVEMSSGNSKQSDCESSISNTQLDGSEASIELVQDTDSEMRILSETTGNHEDCSTSECHQPKSARSFHRTRSHSGDNRRSRKRWRGRDDDFDLNKVPYDESSQQELTQIMSNEGPIKYWTSDGTQRKDANYENMLGVKELAVRGMTTEVVEEVNVIDPCFFDLNPLLLFQLKQVEFLKLVNSGDYSGAVKVASSHLGPLAARDPTLLKPLKETLVLLLTPDQAAFKTDLPLLGLASSLQVAIGKRLGIEEPRLMKIMRAMLHTHNEWFKLQMCKDRFESLLKIDSLKAVPSLLPDVIYQSNTDTCTQGSSQVTVSSGSKTVEDGYSPAQVSSRDLCYEGAILKVMEFLALPRADAIHLLAQYNGDAEAVIQQLFA